MHGTMPGDKSQLSLPNQIAAEASPGIKKRYMHSLLIGPSIPSVGIISIGNTCQVIRRFVASLHDVDVLILHCSLGLPLSQCAAAVRVKLSFLLSCEAKPSLALTLQHPHPRC